MLNLASAAIVIVILIVEWFKGILSKKELEHNVKAKTVVSER